MYYGLSLRTSLKYIVFTVGIILGWTMKGIYLDIQGLTCNDFSTKHTMWRGFISTKDGEVRCFWLEQSYPWRVKQGVTE
jgi:hypothetical protein